MPIRLVERSRFAGVGATGARIGLALLAALMLLSALVPSPAVVGGDAEIAFHASIVEAVRHGVDYYSALAQAPHGADAPVRSLASFPLPALSVIAAHLPPAFAAALLYALAATVLYVWSGRLSPAFRRPAMRFAVPLLLAAGMTRLVETDAAVLPETWAGLLIALSLAVRTRDRRIESVGFGLAAMLICETAALYAALMALFAWIERERRESLGWMVALAVLGAAILAHAAAAEITAPLDLTASAMRVGAFVQWVSGATALSLAPRALAGPIVVLALFGWAGWRDPLALRALGTFCVFAALTAFTTAGAWTSASLVAAPLLVGLVFVPDALGDLVRAALDKRRTTVTEAVW